MADIDKFERVKRYFEHHPHELPSEGGVVIDVGGISLYYNLLAPLFYPAQLYILNIDPDEIKGAPSIVASAFQLPFKKKETCES